MKCKLAYAWTFDKGSMGMGCNFIVASLVYVPSKGIPESVLYLVPAVVPRAWPEVIRMDGEKTVE